MPGRRGAGAEPGAGSVSRRGRPRRASLWGVYHLELRKFPHTACRFNQSEAQLRAIVVPWARQEWVEEGERSWNINEAALTILEGPKLSMPELAMGRGWRNAQKRSEDVTQRVLEAARAIEAQGGAPQVAAPRPTEDAGVSASDDATAPASAAGQGLQAKGSHGEGGRDPAGGVDAETQLLADSLGLEVLALLDAEALAPARVWGMARERIQGRSLADALELADLALGSLLGRGLAVLRRQEAAGDGETLSVEEARDALGTVDAWTGGAPGAVVIARKA